MNKKADEALEASIEHWRDNVAAEKPEDASVDSEDCALCQLFPRYDCAGCPVMKKTGGPNCYFSPYVIAFDRLEYWRGGIGSRDAFRKAAQAELDFLISLREEEK